MRKCSSFMCVLVVLLAGGAEAQRPMAKEALFGVAVLGVKGAAAWTAQAGCRKFSEIYTNGEDMINRMWNDAFEYTTDEAAAYTMWWFEGGVAGTGDAHANPNDAITVALGGTVPDQCELSYWHKDAPTPEGPEFTECHPWHANACCHQATVVTPQALRDGYGPGYEWDRCGPLSQACERFFVQEACFYECEVNAGLYRKFTDAQHAACGSAADGATVTLSDGSPYTCQVSPWGGNQENQWQLYKMPIKASFADAWYRACANDLFCGTGDYFACAGDYHAQIANETYWAERWANESAAANLAALEAAKAEAAALAAAESALEQALEKEKDSIPVYGIILIAVAGVLALLLCLCIVHLFRREKAGKPVFAPLAAPTSTSTTPTTPADSVSMKA